MSVQVNVEQCPGYEEVARTRGTMSDDSFLHAVNRARRVGNSGIEDGAGRSRNASAKVERVGVALKLRLRPSDG